MFENYGFSVTYLFDFFINIQCCEKFYKHDFFEKPVEDENNRKCVVKDKIYDFYYQRGGRYVSYISQAILEYSQIPDYVKNDERLEIIFLDSAEGLELIATEKEPSPKV